MGNKENLSFFRIRITYSLEYPEPGTINRRYSISINGMTIEYKCL